MLASRLHKGDLIGVVTPSDSICEEDKEYISKSKKFLEDMGYRVKFSRYAFDNTFGYSMSGIKKADDINQMFLDSEVKAILTMGGGESCFNCLEYIDYSIVKKNPKIFIGYSDIDTLTLALYKKTGLVTFNGICFKSGFSKRYDEYSVKEFFDRLENCKIGEVCKCDDWISLNGGIAEGILVGGNLSILSSIAGTEYFPDFQNKILFIEDYGFESSPANICKILHILKYHGVFDSIKGMLIGNYEHESGIKLEDIVRDEVLKNRDMPIVKCTDFGHGAHHTVLPIGVNVRLNADNKVLEILDLCVK